MKEEEEEEEEEEKGQERWWAWVWEWKWWKLFGVNEKSTCYSHRTTSTDIYIHTCTNVHVYVHVHVYYVQCMYMLHTCVYNNYMRCLGTISANLQFTVRKSSTIRKFITQELQLNVSLGANESALV